MPMSRPASIAWKRKTAWIASRTGLLPRNEKLTLEMPPETSAPGRFCLIQRVASMKSRPYVACSSMPVATANTLGSKMMSSAGKPTCSVRIR